MTPLHLGNGNKFPILGNSLVSLVSTSDLKPDLARRKAGDQRVFGAVTDDLRLTPRSGQILL